MGHLRKSHGRVVGGSVLDVATQEGNFVQLLAKKLQSYTQIVGIDIAEEAIKKAQERVEGKNIQFLVMNAEYLGFEDESFDTVSISASLHHLPKIRQVLMEMDRVLKSGGNFILTEMHRDGQTEAELTSVYLHHWVGDVDTALGRLHNHTLMRQELIDYVESLGLSQIEYYDTSERDTDPMEEKTIEQMDELIVQVTRRAKKDASDGELAKRGGELRERLHKVGAQKEPILISIGKK